jgi:hypothetical protein
MNFNFNFKDMLEAAGQSIRRATNARDLHHTEKYGIKRMMTLVAGTGLLIVAAVETIQNGAQ